MPGIVDILGSFEFRAGNHDRAPFDAGFGRKKIAAFFDHEKSLERCVPQRHGGFFCMIEAEADGSVFDYCFAEQGSGTRPDA